MTRDRVLVVTAAAMTAVAGTTTTLYLTGQPDPPAPRAAAPTATRTGDPAPSRNGPDSAAPATVRTLKAGYAVRGKWKDGFNAEVTVTNLGSQPVEGWMVQLQLPAAVDLTSAWGAKVEQQAGRLTLRSQPWNTYLEAGGSIRMGFAAKGVAAEPTGCTVNGSPC